MAKRLVAHKANKSAATSDKEAMMKNIKKNHKVGHGGIRCPCCNPLSACNVSMKRTKQYLNRWFRRTTKNSGKNTDD
jgi:hypothetical protein